jgi:hypothetical protein
MYAQAIEANFLFFGVVNAGWGAGIPGSGAVGPAIVRKPSLFCEGFCSSILRHLATN